MPAIILFQSLLYKINCFTHSSSPSEGAASSISMGINLPLDGCSGVFFFFLLTLLRITLAKSFMSSFCVDCNNFEETLIANYLLHKQLDFRSGILETHFSATVGKNMDLNVFNKRAIANGFQQKGIRFSQAGKTLHLTFFFFYKNNFP